MNFDVLLVLALCIDASISLLAKASINKNETPIIKLRLGTQKIYITGKMRFKNIKKEPKDVIELILSILFVIKVNDVKTIV